MTNSSNLVKRNVKALSPDGGDPEWVDKWKEKDRKLQELTNFPISLTASKSKPVGTTRFKLYNKEKEDDGQISISQQKTIPARKSPRIKAKYTHTPPIPCPSNSITFECVEAMEILVQASKLHPLLVHCVKV
jgi:hypothetical protein